ncbi:MAG: hypothetical protein LBD20_03015 [Spirochaetaceae bacterium]|jgi:hypothetical protein|nr:hypothetical protein [Spirochaetaceae bacterium]
MFFPVDKAIFRLKKAGFLVVLGLSAVFSGFSQANQAAKLEDTFTTFNDYAADVGAAMAFLGGVGLAWSDPYIGHLINPIPHWGAGISLGITTIGMTNLTKLNEFLQVEMAPFIGNKQMNLIWTAELRIGGFRGIPFDLGVKYGILPALPLFGETSYNINIVGGDLRFRVKNGYGIGPEISVGLEFNLVNGGYDTPMYASIFEETTSSGTGRGYRITPNDGAIMSYKWNATVIDFKVSLGKTFPSSRFTFYGGAKGGVALTQTTFAVTGPDVAWGLNGSGSNRLSQYTPTKWNTEPDKLQGFLPFGISTMTADGISILFDGFAVNVQGHIGIAFDFDNRWHLSLAYMMDVLHFDSGISLSFRYQQ